MACQANAFLVDKHVFTKVQAYKYSLTKSMWRKL